MKYQSNSPELQIGTHNIPTFIISLMPALCSISLDALHAFEHLLLTPPLSSFIPITGPGASGWSFCARSL